MGQTALHVWQLVIIIKLMHVQVAVGFTPIIIRCSFLRVLCSGLELQGEVKKPCLSPGHAALPRQCSTLKPEAPACLSFSLGVGEEVEDRGPSAHDYSAQVYF